MLNPEQSIIAVVDGLSDGRPTQIGEVLRLIACARALGIPALGAYYPEDLLVGAIQSHASMNDVGSWFPVDPVEARWQSTALALALQSKGRRQLLICGIWLEEAVSILAHQTSLFGLDVHVCIDASPALRPDQVSVLQARLVQHNIVVTTSELVVRHWLALASPDNRAAAQRLLQGLKPRSP